MRTAPRATSSAPRSDFDAPAPGWRSNYSAAESGIKDADVAAEAANLTKAQVLQQASLAALAQANSAPQAVLSLLKG